MSLRSECFGAFYRVCCVYSYTLLLHIWVCILLASYWFGSGLALPLPFAVTGFFLVLAVFLAWFLIPLLHVSICPHDHSTYFHHLQILLLFAHFVEKQVPGELYCYLPLFCLSSRCVFTRLLTCEL